MRLPTSASLIPVLAFAALATSLLACDTVQLKSAPEAGVDCTQPRLENPCVPQPAGTPGCTATVPAVGCFGRVAELSSVLDAASTYPAASTANSGCGLIVYNPTPDEDLHCTELGVCHCYAEDGGTFAWSCAPCIDAGP